MKKDYGTYIIIVIISVVLSTLINLDIESNDNIKISSIQEGTGLRICTESVQSVGLLDREDNTYIQLYNLTQEELNEVVSEHPNGEVFQDLVCTGETLTITND